MKSEAALRQKLIKDLWNHIEEDPSVMLDPGEKNLPMESVVAHVDRDNGVICILFLLESPVFQASKCQSRTVHLSIVSNDHMFRALLKGELVAATGPDGPHPVCEDLPQGQDLEGEDCAMPVMLFKPQSATITGGRSNYMDFGWDLFATKSTKSAPETGYSVQIDF